MIQRSSWLYLSLWTWCSAVVSVLAFKSGGGKHYLQLHFFTILTVSTSLHQTANISLHAAHSSSRGAAWSRSDLSLLEWALIVLDLQRAEKWVVIRNEKKVLGLDGWIFITQCCYWWTLPSSSSCSLIIMLTHSSSVTGGSSSYLQDLSTGWTDLFCCIHLILICDLETRKR